MSLTADGLLAPAPLTLDEQAAARAVIRAFGWRRKCADCGRALPAGAFTNFGDAMCRACDDRRRPVIGRFYAGHGGRQ